MNKKPEITEQTKENLRTAFWQLYCQKPIEKIAIKEITDAAGYHRGTFYLYYKDVYDLFAQIENELLEKADTLIQESLAKNDGFDIFYRMGVLMDLSRTYSPYMSVLLSDHGDPHFAAQLKKIIWPLINRCFVPLTNHSNYEIDLLSEFYLSGILAVITRWLSDSSPQMTIEELVTFILKNVFNTELKK